MLSCSLLFSGGGVALKTKTKSVVYLGFDRAKPNRIQLNLCLTGVRFFYRRPVKFLAKHNPCISLHI